MNEQLPDRIIEDANAYRFANYERKRIVEWGESSTLDAADDGPAIMIIVYLESKIEALHSELATARESEKHSIEFTQRDNDLDAKIRNESIEMCISFIGEIVKTRSVSWAALPDMLRTLKLQPLNTNGK